MHIFQISFICESGNATSVANCFTISQWSRKKEHNHTFFYTDFHEFYFNSDGIFFLFFVLLLLVMKNCSNSLLTGKSYLYDKDDDHDDDDDDDEAHSYFKKIK